MSGNSWKVVKLVSGATRGRRNAEHRLTLRKDNTALSISEGCYNYLGRPKWVELVADGHLLGIRAAHKESNDAIEVRKSNKLDKGRMIAVRKELDRLGIKRRSKAYSFIDSDVGLSDGVVFVDTSELV